MTRTVLAALARAALPITAVLAISATAQAEGLPNGATALNETFNDWSVNCRAQGKEGARKTNCTMQQVQMQKNTRKRVLTVSFAAQPGGAVKGSIILPFGLDLAGGVKLRIDAGEPTAPIPFRTCVPMGCLIPIDWKAETTDALRKATALKIEVRSVDGKDMPFSVSLKGFGAALDRASSLTSAE